MSLVLKNDFLNKKSLVSEIGPAFSCSRAVANATYYDSNGVLQTADANTGRFNHNPLTLAPRGLMTEPPRENLLLNSGVPVTQSVTVAAVAHSISVFGTGSITLTGTGSGTATEGNPLTFTPTAGTLTVTITGSLDRFQLEEGAFATSWVETFGTSVERNGDVVDLSDMSFVRYEEGILYGHFEQDVDDAASYSPFSLDSGFSTSRLASQRLNTVQGRLQHVASGSTLNLQISETFWGKGKSPRLVLAYALNDIEFYANELRAGTGDQSQPILNSALPMVKLRIGLSYAGGTGIMAMHTKEVRYYDNRFTPAEEAAMGLGVFPAFNTISIGFHKIGQMGRAQ